MDDTQPVRIAKRDQQGSVFDQPSFGFGDETKALPATRTFAFEQYGARESVPGTVGVAQETFERPPADPLVRIEKSLEHAIAKIGELQRRIESIEAILSDVIR